MSFTALVRNKSTMSITLVTDINQPTLFQEFVNSVSSYYTPLDNEIEFKVLALIDTESDPLIQTFDSIQSMSMKNFFKSLEKVGQDLSESLSESHPDASRMMKLNMSKLVRDVALKF